MLLKNLEQRNEKNFFFDRFFILFINHISHIFSLLRDKINFYQFFRFQLVSNLFVGVESGERG